MVKKKKKETRKTFKNKIIQFFNTLKDQIIYFIETSPEKISKTTVISKKKLSPFKRYFLITKTISKMVIHYFIYFAYKYSTIPWFIQHLKPFQLRIKKYFELYQNWKNENQKKYKIGRNVVIAAFLFFSIVEIIVLSSGISFKADPIGPTNVEAGALPDPLRIHFEKPVAPLDQLNKNLTQGVKIHPEIMGNWRWQNDSELVFTPLEDWAVGTDYKVKFKASFFAKHVSLRSYSLGFSSAPFKASITSHKLYQDPINPKINKVVATVKFSHSVDSENFLKNVSISISAKGSILGGDKLNKEISYNKTKTEAYIHTEPVEIKIQPQVVVIEIGSSTHSLRGGPGLPSDLSASVNVPDIETFFHIEQIKIALVSNEHSESEQALVIETTAGIESRELEKKLKVYLLPVDRPVAEGVPSDKNYAWFNPDEITPYVLQKSEIINLEPIGTNEEYAQLHSYRLNLPVQRNIFVQVEKGAEAIGGSHLVKTYRQIIQIPDFPKEVKIARSGSILSLSGDKKLTVLSRDMISLKYSIGKIKPTDISHLVTQAYSYNDFETPSFNEYGGFTEDNIVSRFEKIVKLAQTSPGRVQYSSLDFSEYLNKEDVPYGVFILTVNGYDPEKNVLLPEKDRRLIVVTDLGIIVKTSQDESLDVFIQSIHSGMPVSNAHVEILGKNGLPVKSGYTDESGRVHMESLKGLSREKTPVVIKANNGHDLSFLPINMQKRSLEFSRFDVGGEYLNGNEKNLDAYLFSDRGIYRPGDTFHVGVIIKSVNWHNNMAGLPLELVISDPREMEIYRKKIYVPASGFYEIDYTTGITAPTGAYQVKLYTAKDLKNNDESVALLGSTEVKIEEFLPDTMKISLSFNKENNQEKKSGWISPVDLSANVSLWNLFGTPAKDHKISSYVRFSPSPSKFSAYPDYIFHDPLSEGAGSFSERLPDVITNDKGEVEIPLKLQNLDKATYTLQFSAEGHSLDGGRAVTAYRSIVVSPLNFILGYKTDGDLNFVRQNVQRNVHIIAVNRDLLKTEVKNLKLELIEQNYISTLVRQNDGTYSYQSIRKKISKSETSITVSPSGFYYNLSSNKPGDYRVVIRDENKTELSSFEFSVVGQGEVSSRLEKNSELQISLNKKDYSQGEEIKISIRSPYAGSGLISIEREKVYSYIWFKTNNSSSIQSIVAPANLHGNAYINVTFLRDIGSPEIYSSPLSYAVAPFSISREARRNSITLNVPQKIMPGQTLKIGYKTSHPGKIVVFAVNEGILQVARYSTPDPLEYFFRKKALQVRTSQILDLILPEYSILKQLSRAGGGEDLLKSGSNINPFRAKQKPAVAFWSGIIDAGDEGGALYYQVPDYFNGSLRVMAVVVSDQSIGSARENVSVKGNFIITPAVPLYATAGDEFEISVNVANNFPGSGKNAIIETNVVSSKKLKLTSVASQKTEIPENSERAVKFTFKTLEEFGQADISFIVKYGNTETRYTESMSIRPSMPYITKVKGDFVKNANQKLALDRKTYPFYKKTELLLSTIPLSLGYGLNTYLEKYPYGCTEQIISQSIPALVLRSRPEFGYDTKKAKESLEQVIKVLKERQNSSGAFGAWFAGSYIDSFHTVYAAHFLTDLKESGYPVDSHLMGQALKYIYEILKKQPESLEDARLQAYGIYILTRNGVLTSNYLMALDEFIQKQKKFWKKDILSAYMAASFELMKQEKESSLLIENTDFNVEVDSNYDYYYDSLSYNSQLLYLLNRHFPYKANKISTNIINKILAPVFNGQFNTLSSAYTLLALNAYAQTARTPDDKSFKISETINGKSVDAFFNINGIFLTSSLNEKASEVVIKHEGSDAYYYQLLDGGYDVQLPEKDINHGIEVSRDFRNEAGDTVTKAKLGETLTVYVSARSTSKNQLAHIAIIDLLTGGLEVDLKSVRINKENSIGAEPSGEESNNQDSRVNMYGFPQYVDLRDDGIIIFGGIEKSAKSFSYKVRAVNKGKFRVPPIYAESMYNRSINAISKSRFFEITQ
ncbi:MAG: alpha-2-macroglobulin [Spirochaetia bacterium]|nr:alpha-2-macroglobulin [Spirochaetia bacterium]